MSHSREEKIYTIYKTLYKMYGSQGWWPLIQEDKNAHDDHSSTAVYHPGDYSFPRNALERFEICLGAFLTQNTTFASAVKSLQRLKSLDALSPRGIKNLDTESFRLTIKPSGYYNQKAGYILGFIPFFEALEDQVPTREALLGITGIGEETADSILLYAYNQPQFVIDAYTRRIFASLGLIDAGAKYATLKMMIEDALAGNAADPQERIILFQEYHALIVNHAKTFYSRKPYGIGCTLQSRICYT